MRKAIGIVGLVFGILMVLLGIGFAILFGALASVIESELRYFVGTYDEYVALETLVEMYRVFAVIYGFLFTIFGSMQIVNGALAFSKIKDKTIGIISIIFGSLTNTVVLILGILLTVNSGKETAENIQNNVTSLCLTPIDVEIQMLEKQIYLAKLKKEDQVLNSDKYLELEKLKKEFVKISK